MENSFTYIMQNKTGGFFRPNNNFYFICILSFLLSPTIPPIPPAIRSAANLISVSNVTGSSLFVSPVTVISIKIAKPVIKPTTRPADFVILLVIKPPEKAPSESNARVI